MKKKKNKIMWDRLIAKTFIRISVQSDQIEKPKGSDPVSTLQGK